MNESEFRVVATVEYINELKARGIEDINRFSPGIRALKLFFQCNQPSLVVGEPAITDNRCHTIDGGRTACIASTLKFYAIKEEHPSDCQCGCGGGTVLTFLLPDEY